MNKPTDKCLEDTPDYTPMSEGEQHSLSSLTVKDLPTDDQPRERAKRFGIASLSNADLFAIILRTGTRGYPITTLCRDLMKMNENKFINLERQTRDQIMDINGIGELKAMQIEAVMEIVRRYSREKVGDRLCITDSKVVYDAMRPEIANLPYEEMWCLFLNRANRVIGKMRVSQGGSTSTVFDLKKVIKNALMAHAEGIVLCHNHPSGNIHPSGPDDGITRMFKEACKTLDLNFVDHLIITTDGYYSYNDSSSIIH